MNAATLAGWFAEHHPEVTPDPERWAFTLPTHEPHELAAALDEWDVDTAPRPAEIGALIREHRSRLEEVRLRGIAHAKFAELRAHLPQRQTDELARKAEMYDERRYVAAPALPRKAS